MTNKVECCGLEDDLAKIASAMRRLNCGVVPIVGEENRLAGMITDRDICLAVQASNKKTSAVKAKEIIHGEVITCDAEDKIQIALKKMRKHQLKRLPVVNQASEVVGVLSISDVLLAVKKDKKLKRQIYATLKGIFEPRPIVLHEIAAVVETKEQ